VVLTTVQQNPKLLDCTQESFLGAIMQCAQLGLQPDGLIGSAYIIPYGKVATLLIGYKGLVDLARRSGQISTIYAVPVHENDDFKYQLGTDPGISHIPAETDAGKFTHVYAVAKLKDGGLQFEVMTKEQVEKIRARSKAKDSGPWQTDYEEMAKKTVLRRLCKLLPTSTEDNRLQKAVSLDELAEIGKPQPIDITLSETTPEVIEADATVKEESVPAESVDDLF